MHSSVQKMLSFLNGLLLHRDRKCNHWSLIIISWISINQLCYSYTFIGWILLGIQLYCCFSFQNYIWRNQPLIFEEHFLWTITSKHLLFYYIQSINIYYLLTVFQLLQTHSCNQKMSILNFFKRKEYVMSESISHCKYLIDIYMIHKVLCF